MNYSRPVRDRLQASIREDTLDWTQEQQARWDGQRMRYENRRRERGSGGASKTMTWVLPNAPVTGWSDGLKDLPADPIPQPRPLDERPPQLERGPAQRCFKARHLRETPRRPSMRQRARQRSQSRQPEILAWG